jgi:FkbM family methyltransferase
MEQSFYQHDAQVKGQITDREAAEVQSLLKQHSGVDDAAVLVREDAQGNTRLIAYIVPHHQNASPILQLLRLEKQGELANKQTYDAPNGMTLINHSQFETGFLYKEIFEKQVYKKHGITLRDNACIFDVGANIGLFTLYAQSVCKNPTIYAFEPSPSIFEILRLNTILYGVNAKLFNCALSSETTNKPFTYYPYCSPMSSFFADPVEDQQVIKTMLISEHLSDTEEEFVPNDMFDDMLSTILINEQIPCEVKTLSQIIDEQGIESIDMLKLDAEKSELNILAGIREEHWQKIKQIVIEIHGTSELLQSTEQMLLPHGYHLVTEEDTILQRTSIYMIYALGTPDTQPISDEPGFQSDGTKDPAWNNPKLLLNDLGGFVEKELPDTTLSMSFMLLEALPLRGSAT